MFEVAGHSKHSRYPDIHAGERTTLGMPDASMTPCLSSFIITFRKIRPDRTGGCPIHPEAARSAPPVHLVARVMAQFRVPQVGVGLRSRRTYLAPVEVQPMPEHRDASRGVVRLHRGAGKGRGQPVADHRRARRLRRHSEVIQIQESCAGHAAKAMWSQHRVAGQVPKSRHGGVVKLAVMHHGIFPRS